MPIDQQRTQFLFQRLSRLLGRLPAKPAPDRVHHLRTTVRRLETLLDALVAEPDRNQRKLMKQLGRVRRRAGKIRDLDVQMAALRTLKIGSDARRKSQLMQDLARARARREKRLAALLDADSLRRLRRRIQRLLAALALGGEAPMPVSAAFGDPVALALRNFARLTREYGALNEQNIHGFRMQCKRVRYVAEMAGDTPAVEAVVKPLKSIQDAIGAWHDWLVLTQRAQKLFGESADVPLLAALRNVTRAKFTEAVRVVAESKRKLMELYRALEAGSRRAPRASARPRAANSSNSTTAIA